MNYDENDVEKLNDGNELKLNDVEKLKLNDFEKDENDFEKLGLNDVEKNENDFEKLKLNDVEKNELGPNWIDFRTQSSKKPKKPKKSSRRPIEMPLQRRISRNATARRRRSSGFKIGSSDDDKKMLNQYNFEEASALSDTCAGFPFESVIINRFFFAILVVLRCHRF